MQSSVTGFQAGRRPFIEIGHYRIHLGANQCAHNIKRVEESDSSIRLLGLRAVALCDKYPLVRSNGFCKQALILPNDVTNHSPFMHYFFSFFAFYLSFQSHSGQELQTRDSSWFSILYQVCVFVPLFTGDFPLPLSCNIHSCKCLCVCVFAFVSLFVCIVLFVYVPLFC